MLFLDHASFSQSGLRDLEGKKEGVPSAIFHIYLQNWTQSLCIYGIYSGGEMARGKGAEVNISCSLSRPLPGSKSGVGRGGGRGMETARSRAQFFFLTFWNSLSSVIDDADIFWSFLVFFRQIQPCP